ncbi:hypothetical protein GDO81_021280 [Engystomops pustulosus]|uniref:Uncharacterized protein n=1 Tax=Engystomops pustulosus TaxID=76066 RepID=A0AAV6ZH23_ENGPU|nr:hypothetical protein GDO81_021280 [Engystomops pustulosus]
MSVCGHFCQVGSDPRLVHGVQEVFGVHGQRVRGGQHLFFTFLAQRGDGVLLGQTHLIDQFGQVFAQEFLRPFNLSRHKNVKKKKNVKLN